jgi:hypothetical protein
MTGDYWSGFLQGIFFWVFGFWILKNLFVMMVSGLVKEEIAKHPEKYGGEILLYLEKHHNMLYCYRKDTDQFIGQGESLQEIANLFVKRYPDCKGRILKEDGAEMVLEATE